jgi:hypothetical protein
MSSSIVSRALAFLLVAPAALAFAPASDTTIPGLLPAGSHAVGTSDAYATLATGDRLEFDGVVIRLVADDGTLIQTYETLPFFVFPSFVRLDPTGTYALVGESTRGKIRRVDLAGTGAPVIADLDFAFDAVFEDAGHVIVSAAPCGFGCGSEFYRLDLASGSLASIGSLTGPSGPLAIAANGDLYYGSIPDAFPPPPSPILHWTQAQLANGTPLTDGNASIFVPGIAPASSMAFDPVYGHLFVAAPVYQGTSEVFEFDTHGQLVASVAQSLDYLSGVELLPTHGPGSFQAFQPDGVNLKYRGTDYIANTSEIRTLRTRRPFASMSGPGLSGPGAVTFRVRGAYPNASLQILVGLASTYNPNEQTIDTGTYLLHTGLDMAHVRRLTMVPTDANGDGTFTFQNPGGLQGTRVFQALVADPNGFFVGSSTAAFN